MSYLKKRRQSRHNEDFQVQISTLIHMRKVWVYCLCLWVWTSGLYAQSGIEAIDTLKVHEWDIETPHSNPTLALGLAALIPGGGHFYTGHYVRGGFIATIETYLLLELFVNYPLRVDERKELALASLQRAEIFADSLTSNFREGQADRLKDSVFNSLSNARLQNDIVQEAYGLKQSQIAWLVGMHLYSVMDTYGIIHNNNKRTYEKKTATSALWRAAILPGWGQIYNDEYGKAGMLWMSLIGSYVSFNARQETVEYYLERLQTARKEERTFEISELDEKVTFFRKKRNQYLWGPMLFYLYSLADASVDALLSDFDAPVNLTLMPVPMTAGGHLEVTWRF